MTKQEWKELTKKSKIILDGATGSNLQKRGMPAGVCPEEWILGHADILCDLQRESSFWMASLEIETRS